MATAASSDTDGGQYRPRRQFTDFHARKNRWAVIVAHRRAGKTVACINDLIAAAGDFPAGQNGRFGYLAPYYAQAKDIAWDYLTRYTSTIPGVEFNISELRVDLPHNGARIRLYGAENADRMRGLYFDGVIIDEPADINPRIWPEIIRPALADRKGWAVWIGTPKGHNAFYDLHKQSKTDNWYSLMLKASETGIVDEDELLEARKSMSEDQYAQEFECSFEAAIQGAYYGKMMREAEEEGRITRVPWEPKLLVHTAWDLGIGDANVIGFFQQTGGEVRIIDCYASFGMGLEHYAKVLKEKPYVYGDHILPHDAAVSDLSTGRTRVQTLAGLGINGRVLEREGQIDDGIAAVRSLLPRAWFDAKKCDTLIEAMKQYRTEFDSDRKVYSNRPLHDWCSDFADMMRYAARGLPDQTFNTAARDKYARNRREGGGSWMAG